MQFALYLHFYEVHTLLFSIPNEIFLGALTTFGFVLQGWTNFSPVPGNPGRPTW